MGGPDATDIFPTVTGYDGAWASSLRSRKAGRTKAARWTYREEV